MDKEDRLRNEYCNKLQKLNFKLEKLVKIKTFYKSQSMSESASILQKNQQLRPSNESKRSSKMPCHNVLQKVPPIFERVFREDTLRWTVVCTNKYFSFLIYKKI